MCVFVNKNNFKGHFPEIRKKHVLISNGKDSCNNFEADYYINTGLMFSSQNNTIWKSNLQKANKVHVNKQNYYCGGTAGFCGFFYTLLFKCLGSVRFFYVFEDISNAH